MVEIRKTEAFASWLDGLSDLGGRARILARIERLREETSEIGSQLEMG